uniref:Uncharacterized protein n=1 Tax=Pneumocystis wakefieldiae TaxID=38082 RepID=A0A8A6W595_9ASCO|nr:hypothetical protein MFV12_mgp03 [Pneumocystis wakefieldiae]QTK22283.1 hypothetical protein [Pneumocystis wakefieldiae]
MVSVKVRIVVCRTENGWSHMDRLKQHRGMAGIIMNPSQAYLFIINTWEYKKVLSESGYRSILAFDTSPFIDKKEDE